MDFAYALVILTFIHGSPPKFEGFVASVFQDRELCCKSLDLFARGQQRYRSLAMCVQFSYEDDISPTETQC